MGSFRALLVELSRNPAMIAWLDNNDNHDGAINENYGRELLELFSMGVGQLHRAGPKGVRPRLHRMDNRQHRLHDASGGERFVMAVWSNRLALRVPPGGPRRRRKGVLGHTGQFNGEDIVDIICQQPATARFISRHMYHFFVADEPPVSSWPYVPPRDPEAIDTLCQTYFDSNYDIRSMLRALFNSDFFPLRGVVVREGEEPGGADGRRSSIVGRVSEARV